MFWIIENCANEFAAGTRLCSCFLRYQVYTSSLFTDVSCNKIVSYQYFSVAHFNFILGLSFSDVFQKNSEGVLEKNLISSFNKDKVHFKQIHDKYLH